MANERKFVTEKIRRVLLREYMMKKVGRAGFGGLDVQRTPMGTRVTLITERPGLVIGRRGEAIKSLTKAIEEDFKFNNPQIEVLEVENPNLNAQIMAEKLANALERGWHFRRAGHSTVRRIMDSGARGCQVVIAGKLTGARHRTEKFKEGHIKYCGHMKLVFMHHGFAVAKLKPGVIGVTVQIMDPKAKLPDEIEIIPPPAAPAAAPETEAAKPSAETKAEERKVSEAVAELKKTAPTAPSAEAPKPKRPRKKKEGEQAAPGAPGDEKKPVKRRKKKEDEAPAAGEGQTAAQPAEEAPKESGPAPPAEEKPKAAEEPAPVEPSQQEPPKEV
nr:30S ribosomal protein S3P [uncultured archaeon]